MKFREIFLISLLLTSTVVAQDDQNLPDIGDSSGSLISPEFDRRLGSAFLREVRRSARLIYDPEVEAYIESIGYRLATNSDSNQANFTFFVINDPMINAFAGPGGIIGINSGVILNSTNESELAAVIAHEIAHVTQRHLARTFERANKFSLPMAAAIIGAIILGTQSPEAGAAALQSTIGLSVQDQINFTRANEKEADSIGMQLLARSGYDPEGMPGFFEKLQQGSRFYQGNAPEFLRTHPLTTSRIAESQARAERYEEVSVDDTDTYQLVKAKIQAFTYEKPEQAVTDFKQALQEANNQRQFNVARYGYIYSLTRDQQYSKARKQARQLLEKDPHNSAYMMAAAYVEHQANNFRAAIKIFQEMQKYYPDYRPLIINYAKTLLDNKQPVKAREVLLSYGRNNEEDITYLNLLSQAEAQAGSETESHIVKAEYYYLLGDTQLAIGRLRLAKKLDQGDYYQKERITARLTQLEYERELEEELEL